MNKKEIVITGLKILGVGTIVYHGIGVWYDITRTKTKLDTIKVDMEFERTIYGRLYEIAMRKNEALLIENNQLRQENLELRSNKNVKKKKA